RAAAYAAQAADDINPDAGDRDGDNHAPYYPLHHAGGIGDQQLAVTNTNTSTSATRESWFADAWQIYPPRTGSNPRAPAERAWGARVREGVAESDLLAGTKRYRAWCDALGKTGTELVMQAQRFYGTNREFENPWVVPAADLEQRVAAMQRE